MATTCRLFPPTLPTAARLALLGLAVLGAACSAAGPAPATPAEPSKTIRLGVGASALLGTGQWQVGFEGVTSDSRCPKNAHCIWAGEAGIRLWLQNGSGPRMPLDLHVTATGSGGGGAVGSSGLEVHATTLEPYPVVGQRLDPKNYVVTLVLTTRTAGNPER